MPEYPVLDAVSGSDGFGSENFEYQVVDFFVELAVVTNGRCK